MISSPLQGFVGIVLRMINGCIQGYLLQTNHGTPCRPDSNAKPRRSLVIPGVNPGS